MITAYILFGLLHISYQIENPFGYDVNDLDLDRYCRGLAIDLDLICSYMPSPDPKDWLYSETNHPLWPLQRPCNFNDTDMMGMDTVKARLDERRRRVMELWGKGLERVEEERSKRIYLRHDGDSSEDSTSSRARTETVAEREVSAWSSETIV